jgi:NAD(P)-dependent dehydrogenase (short-subunit alcohol dehydrogenase family)
MFRGALGKSDMQTMGMLTGKVVLVTGATSGIGTESARLFAKEGARLALVGRRREQGEALALELVESGAEAVFLEVDLADTDSLAGMMARIVDRFGRLDAAFNNAGKSAGRGGIEMRSVEGWDALNSINLRSAFFCMQAQVTQFRRQAAGNRKNGGAIVFNASVLASIGQFGTAMYSATKGGLVAMARAAAVELGPESIRVNTVSASITRTPMTISSFVSGADTATEHPIVASTPLRRVAEPAEIAQGALFLLSDRASYITGHDLVIDGGLSAG